MGVGGRVGREGGVGGGGHHQPIHRLPLVSRSGSPSLLLSFFSPSQFAAGGGGGGGSCSSDGGGGTPGAAQSALVLGWRREKEGREAFADVETSPERVCNSSSYTAGQWPARDWTQALLSALGLTLSFALQVLNASHFP
uniref:Uncharacterized protein n=1 Tax=Molossus molossus TaxID=27622 RepID=A0A7J8CZM7_MOLMO|nr:hypothetical protein HJG59_009486 [Molossus molossus]